MSRGRRVPILDILAYIATTGGCYPQLVQPVQPVAQQAALSSEEVPAGVFVADRASLGLDCPKFGHAAMWGPYS